MSVRGLVLLLVGLILLPTLAAAQSYGDGFAVGGVLLPSGSGTLVAKTRMGDGLGIEVELGLSTYSDGDFSSSDLQIGGGALFYTGSSDKLQPYWGARFRLGHTSSDMPAFEYRGDDDSNSNTTFGFVGVYGAEYFITKRLSLEGEAGIGMYFGSFSLRTETRLAGFIYL